MPRNDLPEPYELPDGRWRVAVQKGHGSREHRIRAYLSASSPELVREKRDKWYQALEQGQRPPDRRLTVGTYLRRWIANLTVRERTAESYRMTMEKHVIPRIGGTLLSQLGPLDIDDMLTALAKSGVKPPTRAYSLRVLSVALNVAVTRKRLIPYNPALGADVPVVVRRKPTMLTDEQMAKLNVVLEKDRMGPLLRLMAMTAIRRGEALSLTWANWDRDAGLLSIETTLLYRAGKGFERVKPKTDSSVRVIRLSVAAQSALRAQAKKQAAERIKRGRAWHDNDLIFTAEQNPGGALSGATVVHAMHRLCDEAGVPRLRPHDLRHAASTYITRAVGIAQASAVLGHSSVRMTERYTHLSPTSQEAADAIDRVFGPSAAPLEAVE